MPAVQTVLNRLYISAFWVLTAAAVMVPAFVGVTRFHDHVVVQEDFACMEQKSVQWSERRDAQSVEGSKLGDAKARLKIAAKAELERRKELREHCHISGLPAVRR